MSVDLDLRETIRRKKLKENQFEPNNPVNRATITSKNGKVEGKRGNEVWVTSPDGGTFTAQLPSGSDVKPVPGTPVNVGHYPKSADDLKVIGLYDDNALSANLIDTAAEDSVTTYIERHWYPAHYVGASTVGSDPGLINPRMIEPFRITATGGLTVELSPFAYHHKNRRRVLHGKQYDLTSYRPDEPGKLWLAIHINIDNQTIEFTQGEVMELSSPARPEYPELPDGVCCAGYVLLYHGQETILEYAHIEDGRTPFDMPTITIDQVFPSANEGDILIFNGTEWEAGALYPICERIFVDIEAEGVTSLIPAQGSKRIAIHMGGLFAHRACDVFFVNVEANTKISETIKLDNHRQIWPESSTNNPHIVTAIGQSLGINCSNSNMVSTRLHYRYID